uniref:glucuronyl hydrolase n=1 Tax=uncultured Draconibacterium sp. TaxID=1573823 RepID=UPI00321776A2
MNKLFSVLLLLSLLAACSNKVESISADEMLEKCHQKIKYQVNTVDHLVTDKLVAPRTVDNNEIKMVTAWDWTSGFFAGTLWMMYDYTGDAFWKEKADFYTRKLESEQWNNGTHDLGFKMYGSYGKGYELTQNTAYRDVLIQSAKTLASRYNPKVGCIRSWDHGKDKWQFPVIIDNMMNLELLYWAAKETGNDTLRTIATNHAMTTLKNHFREDNSTWHVIDYDPETGEVRKRNTAQGYADESSWSKGQAWALYGYTMVYRETGMPIFLKQAEKVAKYILCHPNLPKDMVPYWDYDAPNNQEQPRDASAAAITASALFELSQYSKSANKYKSKASAILAHLSNKKYFAENNNNGSFLLKHSTGSIPHNEEIDVPINYADYYFIEALLRARKLQ